MNFTQHKEFRNSFDTKSLVVESAYRGVMDDSRLDNMLNEIRREKEMETRQEYLQGCRESDIRALIKYDSFADLIDRIANFVNQKQSDEFKDIMIQFIIDNNLVDDEELQWYTKNLLRFNRD